ncbi:hypothetical protein [Alteraurantiacibacter aquimixticola]|uniref:Uncharacterized protein n=1 Tax=Alteraurantiacibacter aquimixticola TaxID=2489173 RepID=A0A4T3F4C6_9SPHN|nr:hypothetical protein [Alteraurantiacibacter aquimixticola]TIX50358.1 hypothetical protein E5222_08755 [Alteraurantiacibacter aquimixticola]
MKIPISVWLLAITILLYAVIGGLAPEFGELGDAEGLFLIIFVAIPVMIFLHALPIAAMVGTMVEVFVGRVPKAWLAFPFSFGALYIGLLAVEQWEIGKFEWDTRAQLSAPSNAFDPDTQSIVLSQGSGVDLTGFDVPVVYFANPAGANFGPYTATYLLAGGDCEVLRGEIPRMGRSARIGRISGDPRPGRPGLCSLRAGIEPDGGIVQITVSTSEARTGWASRYREHTIRLRWPGGEERTLRSYSASRLPLLPRPSIPCLFGHEIQSEGCALIFERDGLMTVSHWGDLEPGSADLVAQALQLRPDPFMQRATLPIDEARAVVEKAASDYATRDLPEED